MHNLIVAKLSRKNIYLLTLTIFFYSTSSLSCDSKVVGTSVTTHHNIDKCTNSSQLVALDSSTKKKIQYTLSTSYKYLTIKYIHTKLQSVHVL